MKIKYLIILLLFTNNINAVQCSIDKRIMYSIAQVEKHNKRVIGYQYLISFNNKNDAYMAKNIYPFLFLDDRTIDCENETQCSDILYNLQTYGIDNLDCGTFQINTKFWNMPYENYFNLEKSYKKACSIVEFYTKKELNWKNIAKYHSGTKKHNEKYQELLYIALKKNLKNKFK